MDNYLGYQLMINGLLMLPRPEGMTTNIIENGSYSVTKTERVANEWTDANGHLHRELYEDSRTIIRFTIKDRTAEQHSLLYPLFNRTTNDFSKINVEYWDDENFNYKTGVFYISEMEAVSSIATEDNIFYAPLMVTLTEY